MTSCYENITQLKSKNFDFDSKISDIESKYFTTFDYDKFMNEIIDNKIKGKELDKRSDFSGFIENTILDKKIATLAPKVELKAEQDKKVKLHGFILSYIRVKIHFEDDDTQNYLLFQPIYRYLEKIGNSIHISAWKSKRFPDEIIKSSATSGNSFASSLNYIGLGPRIKFDELRL